MVWIQKIEFVSVTPVARYATMTSIRIKQLALVAIVSYFQCYISRLSLVQNVFRIALLALKLKVIQISLINVYALACKRRNMTFRKISAFLVATQEPTYIMISASPINA